MLLFFLALSCLISESLQKEKEIRFCCTLVCRAFQEDRLLSK